MCIMSYTFFTSKINVPNFLQVKHKCARPQETLRGGGLYLHGDVCYGGGGQIKVLLDQNVEFGSQVSPSTNAVNFTGEQR